jgi:hypothetical protein
MVAWMRSVLIPFPALEPKATRVSCVTSEVFELQVLLMLITPVVPCSLIQLQGMTCCKKGRTFRETLFGSSP